MLSLVPSKIFMCDLQDSFRPSFREKASFASVLRWPKASLGFAGGTCPFCPVLRTSVLHRSYAKIVD